MTLQACHAAMPRPGQQADTVRVSAAPARSRVDHAPVPSDAPSITGINSMLALSPGKTVQMDAFDQRHADAQVVSNANASAALADRARGPQRAAIELSEGVRQLCEADSRLACVCPHGTPTMVSVFAA